MVKNSVRIAQISVIASIYSATTILLGPIGYSWIQVRIGEAFTPMPFLMGYPAVVGLTLGSLISNLFSPIGLPDIVFGSLLTLLAAMLSWKFTFNKRFLACLYPVIINAIGVSLYISPFFNIPYLISVLTVGVGEIIAVIVVGYPLLIIMEKIINRNKIKEKNIICFDSKEIAL